MNNHHGRCSFVLRTLCLRTLLSQSPIWSDNSKVWQPHIKCPLCLSSWRQKCVVDAFYSGTWPAAPWPAGCDSAISCLWERRPREALPLHHGRVLGQREDVLTAVEICRVGCLEAVRCWVDLSLSRMYSRSCVLGRICLVHKYLYIRHCIVLGIQRYKRPDFCLWNSPSNVNRSVRLPVLKKDEWRRAILEDGERGRGDWGSLHRRGNIELGLNG